MKELLSDFIKKKSFAKGIPLVFTINKKLNQNPEYYKLAISPKLIALSATTESGILYGLQTFFQLLDKTNQVDCMEIEDWPDFSKRGFITGSGSFNNIKRLLPYKFNMYWMCGGGHNCRQWFRPMTTAEKAAQKEFVEQTNNYKMPLVYGMRPGFGKHEIHFSDPIHIKAVLNKYTNYYNSGIRNFYLAYDDLFNIGRDKLTFKDDIKRFKNIGKAHYFLADNVYKHLQSLNPKNKLYVIPMYYYDPTFYSKEEKDYLRSLGALPVEVEFINCGTLTDTGINNAIKITGRKPFFWSNFMAQYESMKVRPKILNPLSFKRPKNITKKMNGFMFVLWPKHTMMKELFADFLWNADRFNPDKSFATSLHKHAGKGADTLTQFIEFKKRLKGYPFAGIHKEEILLLTGNTVNSIDAWKQRINKLPAKKQAEIIKELDAMTSVYKMLLEDFKTRQYPINVSRTTSGFSSLKTVAAKFVLPGKTWENGIPNHAQAQTEVKAGYDNKSLYIQFICAEPKADKLRARHTRHDSMIFTDDCVEFFLQPPNATKYYHVVINSLGRVYDVFGADKKWNSNAEVKVQKNKKSWTISCKIPLKSLGVTSLKGQAWKINFMREKHSGKKEFSAAFPVLNNFHEKDRLWKVIFN
jgi:beta-N-acetylglucosaminidase/Carbohydrate-binding family 9/Glycosyl hydrolase family 20, domain 2